MDWFCWIFADWYEVQPEFKDLDRFETLFREKPDEAMLSRSRRVYERIVRGTVARVKS